MKVVLRIYRLGLSPLLCRPLKTQATISSWILSDLHFEGVKGASPLKRYNLSGHAVVHTPDLLREQS